MQSTQEDLDHVNENYANCKIELATTQKRFADATNSLDSMRVEMQKNMEGNITNKVENTRLKAKLEDIEAMNKTIKQNNERLLLQLSSSESRVKELESETKSLADSNNSMLIDRDKRSLERVDVETALQKVVAEIEQIKLDHEKGKKITDCR